MPDKNDPIMRVHLKPCPFCGKAATREWSTLNGKEYLSVGCPDFRCRGGHGTTAAPPEQWGFEVVQWNTRDESHWYEVAEHHTKNGSET